MRKMVRLGDVCQKITDGTHHSPVNGSAGAYKYVTAKNIKPWGLDLSDITYVDEETHREIFARCDVQPNDVLLIKDGATTGRVAVNTLREPFSLLSSVGVLRPGPSLESKYLAYALQTPAVQDAMLAKMSGVAITRLTLKKIKDLEIPIVGLDEQQQVVAELEKQFSRLDEAVANLQRVKANLKRYKASVLKAAVEGRLVETESSIAQREGRTYETGEQLLQRILEERRAKWAGKGKYKEATPPVEVDGLHVPDGWVIGSGEQVCSSVRDGTHDTPDYVSTGVPLITSKNLDEHGIDFENVKFISEKDHVDISQRSAVSTGDILFAMIGTIGNPCEVKTEAKFSIKNVALFKANRKYLNPTYFCYWLQSAPLNKWLEPRLKGTTQKFAPLGLLRELPTAMPPYVEQARIVAEVDRHLSIIREVEAEVDANLHRAQSLRQATLAKAFSGDRR